MGRGRRPQAQSPINTSSHSRVRVEVNEIWTYYNRRPPENVSECSSIEKHFQTYHVTVMFILSISSCQTDFLCPVTRPKTQVGNRTIICSCSQSVTEHTTI